MPERSAPAARLVAGAASLVLAAGAGTAVVGVADPAPTTTSVPPAAAPAAGTPAPEALVVPALGLDEPLVPLGLAADGALAAPAGYDDVGWWSAAGSPLVLAGHVDSRDGPAVFARLADVAVGDEVQVRGPGGGRYVVTGVQRYAKDALPTFEVFAADGPGELRLITCTGDFDRGARSYEDNLVVYAQRA